MYGQEKFKHQTNFKSNFIDKSLTRFFIGPQSLWKNIQIQIQRLHLCHFKILLVLLVLTFQFISIELVQSLAIMMVLYRII